jgi:hypothetical protein
MKEIELTQGYVAIVDDEDYEYLSQWKWFASRNATGRYYAVRNEGKNQIRMHREILKAPKGMEVDHINTNTLFNVKKNLRICTRAENAKNLSKPKNNTSGYKGVSRDRRKWKAYIGLNNKKIHIGMFSSPKEAARAYDEKAKELFGKFAKLNFSEGEA